MKTPSYATLILIAAIAASAIAYGIAAIGKRPTAKSAEAFAEAHHAIEAEQFDEAIGLLSGIVRDGEPTAGVYYNLALAQQRAGDTGEAILNYERARLLEPNAPDIRANLERARKSSAIVEAPAPRVTSFANTLSPRTWSAAGATGFLALSMIALGRATRALKWSRASTGAAAAAALIATLLPLAALTIQHGAAEHRVIVSSSEATLRVSPFDASKSITSLTPGRSLRLIPEKQHGEFRLAELASGQDGWVKVSEVTSPASTITDQ